MGVCDHRRGMVEPIHHQGCGGVGSLSIKERNQRAREYSRRCRRWRLWRTLLAVNIVLATLLTVVSVCAVASAASVDKPEKAAATDAAMAILPALKSADEVKSGVFDICGYCACCTPYADINRDENGRVLTASGQWVEIGQCVAVDTDIIPLGSTVVIDGQAYTALDTGVKGYVVDILMSHEDAHSAGVKTELVKWRTAQNESP